MNRLRSYGSIVLAALLLVVGHVLIVPLPVLAGSGTPPTTVPAPIEVPPGYARLFSSHAIGVQVYECPNGQWTLRAPRALLVNSGSHRPSAIHFGGIERGLTAGPWWESLHDGSRIRGGNAVSAPSPNTNSIPQLRLEVLERQGTGVFSPASYIQRLNTVGGIAPTGSCWPGAQRPVPYTADYDFYGTP